MKRDTQSADTAPTLADVCAAYEAGVRSGQRHPDADDYLIRRSADAYVKSIWDYDRVTGALIRNR